MKAICDGIVHTADLPPEQNLPPPSGTGIPWNPDLSEFWSRWESGD